MHKLRRMDIVEEVDPIGMVPSQLKNLRACLSCSLIKTLDQFHEHGCENCGILGKGTNVAEFTSKSFKGFVSVMNPKDSWVGKYLEADDLLPGIYAMSVEGQLTPEYVEKLDSIGRKPIAGKKM